MSFIQSFLTIKQTNEFKFKEKGSLFHSIAFPINTEEDFTEKLASLKKQYYDATHHCYAYKLMTDDEIKYSDDGEPGGTAGMRILNAINHFGLNKVGVIVIRYYGGTKLGVGPLGKAYYYAAEEGLQSAKQVTLTNYLKAKISFDFDLTSQAHHFLGQHHGEIIDTAYDPDPAIIFLMKPCDFDHFIKGIKEATSSRAKVEILQENLFK